MATPRDKFFAYIDDSSNQNAFIARLTEAVGYDSVSAGDVPRTRVLPMGQWLLKQLLDLKVDAEFYEIPDHPEAPPLVIGRIGQATDRKTVLVYGHYDVQPADAAGWKARNPDAPEPFKLTRLSDPDRLVGRGSTDDKGPVTGWLNVIQAHNELGLEWPVNLIFLFEGTEEQAGVGVEEWITKEADGYLKNVDYVCITDNYWLTTRGPTLCYGLRGVVVLTVKVTGALDDLHSGIYGRMVHEPMVDLIKLLSKLVDTNGVITIQGVEKEPTAEEREEAETIGYKVDDLWTDLHGSKVELTEDGTQLLLGRTRYPSLSIHDIVGGRDGTIIPHEVSGKFSIRLVEPQDPKTIVPIVTAFLEAEFQKLNTRNTLTVIPGGTAFPWVGDKHDDNYKAADVAIRVVYGDAYKEIAEEGPKYPLEGGTIPLVQHIEDTLKKAVVLLPMGKSNDGAHSLSEKVDVENYIWGTKLYGEYLYQIAILRDSKY